MTRVAERPVDLGHLNRYTGGSRALNEEILRLFESQCRELLAKLEAMSGTVDVKNWHETTHTLKGAARSVGAFALADAVAEAEAADPADTAKTKVMLARIRNRSETLWGFIEAFLSR
jgi:HPt (histidine-containing phosphotransfer) domain-containing protein